jgi:hypothetical protein
VVPTDEGELIDTVATPVFDIDTFAVSAFDIRTITNHYVQDLDTDAEDMGCTECNCDEFSTVEE